MEWENSDSYYSNDSNSNSDSESSAGGKRVRASCVALMQYASTNRKEGYFNDITIEVGETNILANRMVLSCCCPYFENMFKSDLIESKTGKVEMQKIDGKAVSSIIEFIYTGVITIDNDNVKEVIAAADHLQLDEVRRFCLEEIESKKGETRVRVSSVGQVEYANINEYLNEATIEEGKTSPTNHKLFAADDYLELDEDGPYCSKETKSEKSETRVRVSHLCLLEYANTNRKEGHFNDVTIQVGEESIPANRMVLSCCCPYFEKMFKSNLKESKSSTVEMQEIDGKAVSSLIEFIYTGVITIDNYNVVKLLVAADFLQLDEVRQFCFELLTTMVNLDMCCFVLHTANLYGQQELLDDTFRFMVLNFENVKSKNLLSKSDLIFCIAKMDRNRINENRIYQFLIDWIYFDIESREKDFPEMFQHLNYRNLTSEFLKSVVLNENLVTESNFLMKQLLKISIERSITTQKATKIISCGGVEGPHDMTQVFSLLDEPKNDYNLYLDRHSRVFADESSKIIYSFVGGNHRRRSNDSTDSDDLAYQGWDSETYCAEIDHIKVKWIRAKYLPNYAGAATLFRDNLTALTDHPFAKLYRYSPPIVRFYFPQLQTWVEGPRLKEARGHASALVSHQNCLYAIGGCCDKQNPKILASAETLSNLEMFKYDFKGTRKQRIVVGKSLVLGDVIDERHIRNTHYELKYEVLNVAEDVSAIKVKGAWKKIHSMQTGRSYFAAVSCGDYIYAIGGRSNNTNATKTVERYDPKSDNWTYVEEMEFERSEHAACVLDGKIYVVGGRDGDKKSVKAIECFDTNDNSWSAVGETMDGLYGHNVIAF